MRLTDEVMKSSDQCFIDFTKNDKKVDGGSIKFILLKGIGEAFITREVTDDDMRMALDYYISLNI